MLHTTMQTAVGWRLLSANPLVGVKAPSVPRAEMKRSAVDQAEAFLAAGAGQGLRWQAFFTTWLMTGLRNGEIVGLRWQDVDLEAGEIRLQRSIQRVNGVGLVVKAPKTAGSRCPIPVGADLVALLRQNRAEQL